MQIVFKLHRIFLLREKMGSSDARFRALDHIFHLLVLLTAFGQVQSNCPPPYQFHCDLDLCLYETQERQAFDRSVEICKGYDGALFSTFNIGNIENYIIQTVWVGVEDKGTGNGPKLLEGSDIPLQDQLFDSDPKPAKSRECGRLSSHGMYMQGCDEKKNALCERKPATCPEHWYPIAGDCVKIFQSEKTWEDANTACNDMNARPLLIPTVAHAQGIQDFLNLQPDSTQEYWTGAKKDDNSADITWHDGSTVEDMQPFSLNPYTPTNQLGKCGSLSFSTKQSQPVIEMQMDCLAKKKYMCSLAGDSPNPKPVGSANKPSMMDQGNCGEGWEARPGTDTCYSFINNGLMCAHQATRACEAIGGTLVSIASREEEEYLKESLAEMTESVYWIGLQMTEDKGWHWSDGSPFAFTSWRPDIDRHSVYVSAGLLTKSDMKWDVSQHEDIYAAPICEKHHLPSVSDVEYSVCHASWYGFENHCYFLSDEKRTWAEARKVCTDHGADLATIQNLEENSFIFSEFAIDCRDKDTRCDEWEKSGHCVTKPLHMGGVCPKACGFCDVSCTNDRVHYLCSQWANQGWCHSRQDFMKDACGFTCGCDPAIHNGFWIGLHNQFDVRQYEWADQSEVNFTDWSVNEPANYEGKHEECVTMRVTNGHWAVESCDTKSRGFVCQKPKTINDKKRQDHTTDGCPHGETGHKDKCYTLRLKSMTWEEAKRTCEHNNQSLAIIPNQEASEFFKSEFYSLHGFYVTWIGLHYIDGSVKWVDGSEPTYTDYAWSDTLADLSQEGKCAELNWSGWGDDNCDEKKYFICESHRGVYKVPDDETEKSAEPDDETKKPAKLDDETGKSSKPDDETEKSSEPDDETDYTEDLKESEDHGSILSDQRQDRKTEEAAKSGQLSGGAITGVVIGVLAGLALIVVLVVLVQRGWPLWRQISILPGGARKDDLNIAFYECDQEKNGVDFSTT